MDKIPISKPPCYLYDRISSKWLPFKHLAIAIIDQSELFFSYTNSYSDSNATFTKTITYDYNVYYSRVVPPEFKSPKGSPQTTLYSPSMSDSSGGSEAPKALKIKSMIVLKDPTEANESILIGFDVKSPKFEESNKEIVFVRDLISKIHRDLKYSKEGLIYQVTGRLEFILRKIIKHSLSYIAGLFNIEQGIDFKDKLLQLAQLYNSGDLQQQQMIREYMGTILKNPLFMDEVKSITYKVIAITGIFPAYVELNTMDELSLLLKLKNLFTTYANAPYGSQHHASFSIGNLRYSFIYINGKKDKQRVYIYNDLQRGFRINKHEYFRVKFFDFFPMDSWIESITEKIMDFLQLYFTTVELLGQYDMPNFWMGSIHANDMIICRKIAIEFYEKYKSELDDCSNGKLFTKLTRIIANADVIGYESLSNNCQTIVTDIIAALVDRLQRRMEGLVDLSRVSSVKNQWETEYLKEFLRFGSEFNHKFTRIAPFPLKSRLSYFEIYSDKDTCELLHPKNFKNLQECIKEFRKRPKVQGLLSELDEYLQLASTIHIKKESVIAMEEASRIPDIKLENVEDFSVVSCLLTLTYNDLFAVRREIKLAKECLERLENNDTKEVGVKKCEEMVAKLPELYRQKYKLLDLYKELNYYYYNSVRLGLKVKLVDKISLMGFLIARKPTSEPEENIMEEKVERNEERVE